MDSRLSKSKNFEIQRNQYYGLRMSKYQILGIRRGSIQMDSRLSKSDNFGFRQNQFRGLPIVKIPNFWISTRFDFDGLPIVKI